MKVTDLKSFIEKANIKHNFKYDYSKSKYVNNRIKIIIICPIHGEFLQNSNDHLTNNGCKSCGYDKIAKDRTYDLDTFISKANKVHNNLYSYEKAIYNTNRQHLIITCKIHGDFKCTPINHLNNRGCSKCKRSKGELKVSNWLTENNIRFEEQKKFSGCKNKKELPFDFYLPDYNLLIEYQGEQHFTNRSKYSRFKVNLELRHKLDEIKRNYALNNNFNYLEINYKENIELVLNKKLLK
jgi:hypothetical protein